jgi:hypothetical protein
VSEFTAYLYVQVIHDEDYVCFSLRPRSLFILTHFTKGYEGTPDEEEEEEEDGSYGDEEYDAGGSGSARRVPKKKKAPSKPKGKSSHSYRVHLFKSGF